MRPQREIIAGDFDLMRVCSPDIIIAARLQPGNEDILDYYLLPRVDVLTERLNLRAENGLILDVYRFNNLNFFMEIAQRVRVEGAE